MVKEPQCTILAGKVGMYIAIFESVLVSDLYYFSSCRVAVLEGLLEEPLDNGRPSLVKLFSAGMTSKFPPCDTYQGRVTIPGHWDGLYHPMKRDIYLLLTMMSILVWVVSVFWRMHSPNHLVLAWCLWYLHMMIILSCLISVINLTDSFVIVPGPPKKVAGVCWASN